MENVQQLFKEHLEKIVKETQNILENQKYDSVVFFSGEKGFYHADDIEIPFRPAAHFSRFIPSRKPNGCVIVSKSSDRPIFITYTPDDFWLDHSEQDEDFWKEYFEIFELKTIDEWSGEVKKRSGNVAAYIGPEPSSVKGDWNPKTLIEPLNTGRATKTPYELECLKIANIKAVEGHIQLEKAFRAGASEKELYWEYLKVLGATEHDMPYPPILALNEKSSILHYEHRRDVRGGNSFLVDAGMMHLGYGSDISRTHVSDEAHPVFIELISLLDSLQKELVSKVSIDLDMKKLNHMSHLGVGGLLKESGIITVSAEEAVEKKIIEHFMPHSIGHLLGLQTHDVGFTKDSTVLQENYVTTVEPGIYFNELLMNKLKDSEHCNIVNWQLIEELIPYGGIRIEDNIHVTATDSINLTREAFDTLCY